MCLTVHGLDNQYNNFELLIGMTDITNIEKTTINLRKTIDQINNQNKIDPSKISFITTDNAANLMHIDQKLIFTKLE